MTSMKRTASDAARELNASDPLRDEEMELSFWRMACSLRDKGDATRADAWERQMDARIDGWHRRRVSR